MANERVLWLGPRGYERYVKMPRIDMERGQYGWSNRAEHLGGGVSIARSGSTHYEASMEWNALSIAQASDITDMLDGTYATDANRGLIYFNDPVGAPTNLFNKIWAAPFRCASLGVPSLTKGTEPVLSATPANSFRLPPRSAAFTVGADLATFYAPIPPGHTAQFAFYGPTEQSSTVRYRTYSGGSASSWTNFGTRDIDDYGDTQSVSGVTGIEFSLVADVTLTTALLQITGTTPAVPTVWQAGRGHSGCYVDGNVGQTLNSAVLGKGREEMSVRLVEVGSWL